MRTISSIYHSITPRTHSLHLMDNNGQNKHTAFICVALYTRTHHLNNLLNFVPQQMISILDLNDPANFTSGLSIVGCY